MAANPRAATHGARVCEKRDKRFTGTLSSFDAKGLHWLGNVLDLLFAHRFEAEGELLFDLPWPPWP